MMRAVRATDEACIFSILKGQIGEEYFGEIKKEFEDILQGHAGGLVAVDPANQDVIGYACYRIRVAVAYLETIAVAQDVQSRGIGRELLEEVITSLREHHPAITILNLITDADAKATIRFYHRHGFQDAGIVEDEFIPGTPQIHMKKYLREDVP